MRDDNDVEVTMVMKYQPAISHCEVTSLLMSKGPQMVNKVQKSGLRGRTSEKKTRREMQQDLVSSDMTMASASSLNRNVITRNRHVVVDGTSLIQQPPGFRRRVGWSLSRWSRYGDGVGIGCDVRIVTK